MLHPKSHPANPAWNCCKESPALVGIYADGSAGVICARDAHHFTNEPGKSTAPLPEDWKPETIQDMYLRIVEDVRQAHHEAAGSEDHREYKRSQAAFIAAIQAAYPFQDKYGIYGVWIDCMEPVAYCAAELAKMDRDEARKYIAMGGGFE
jgi:hypothetical protein